MHHEKNKKNKNVEFDMFYLDLMHPNLLKVALTELYKSDYKRSRSMVPINRCDKMRLMHIYPTKKI